MIRFILFLGLFFTTSTLIAQTVNITYPSEISGEPGDILEFPIMVSHISTNDNVLSLTFIFEFENQFIEDISINTENSISPYPITGNRNISQSDFRVGGFWQNPISGSGELFTLRIVLGEVFTGNNQFFKVRRAHLNGLNDPPFLSPAAPIEIPLIIGTTSTDVTFANIDRPAFGVIQESDEFWVYGLVEVPGVTNSSFQSNDLEAWVGYNASSSNPTGSGWSWIPASFVTRVGTNRHEYEAEIGSTLVTGEYVYVSRFRYDGGGFYYGGFNNGFWNGNTNIFGQLEVIEFTSTETETPYVFELGVNYPNPFNPATIIPFSLDRASRVTITIHDVQGRLLETLVDSDFARGNHTMRFDAASYASGVYIYRLKSEERILSRKLTLIK